MGIKTRKHIRKQKEIYKEYTKKYTKKYTMCFAVAALHKTFLLSCRLH